MRGVILFWFIWIGFSLLFGAGAYLFYQQSCLSKWEHSGMKVEYGLFKGCLVERKDGTWVPDNMLREITKEGAEK